MTASKVARYLEIYKLWVHDLDLEDNSEEITVRELIETIDSLDTATIDEYLKLIHILR